MLSGGDLDEGIRLAAKGTEIAERDANIMILGFCYLNQIRILFSKGYLTQAEEVIIKAKRLEQDTTLPLWLLDQMLMWQARIWLAQNKLDLAFKWALEQGMYDDGGVNIPQHIDFHSLFKYILLARILIAQGQLEEAVNLLQSLVKFAEDGERISSLIKIMSLQALAFQSGGDIDQAVKFLEQALKLAEPEGFIRIFVDTGQPMAQLLYEALSREILPEYVQRILAAFSTIEQEDGASKKNQVDQSGMIEPLSEREIEIIQLIAEGLTNQEISNKLFLSVHTVKTHTRNIYSKLDVHHRTEAVVKAKSFGIL